MVRFGADDILRTDDAGVTDEDIDALLAKGEKRTEEVRRMKARNLFNIRNPIFLVLMSSYTWHALLM